MTISLNLTGHNVEPSLMQVSYDYDDLHLEHSIDVAPAFLEKTIAFARLVMHCRSWKLNSGLEFEISPWNAETKQWNPNPVRLYHSRMPSLKRRKRPLCTSFECRQQMDRMNLGADALIHIDLAPNVWINPLNREDEPPRWFWEYDCIACHTPHWWALYKTETNSLPKLKILEHGVDSTYSDVPLHIRTTIAQTWFLPQTNVEGYGLRTVEKSELKDQAVKTAAYQAMEIEWKRRHKIQ